MLLSLKEEISILTAENAHLKEEVCSLEIHVLYMYMYMYCVYVHVSYM